MIKVTSLEDIKCSANWMWAAKMPGEGVKLVRACEAMCEVMKELGVAIDGGKDSLSMAARVGVETVKAPGALVVSAYVTVEDVTRKLTPELKLKGKETMLLHVDYSEGEPRPQSIGIRHGVSKGVEDSRRPPCRRPPLKRL
jgi:phosphoribosylformylglycinamidine synthase